MVSVPGVDLCQFPAATPPAGTVPNFKDPPSHAPALIGVTSVMISWSAIFLLGRLWVSRHRFHIADGMCFKRPGFCFCHESRINGGAACAILAFTFCVAYSGLIFCSRFFCLQKLVLQSCLSSTVWGGYILTMDMKCSTTCVTNMTSPPVGSMPHMSR
jgi:hypothetical protein